MKNAESISFPVGVAYVLPGLARGGTEKHVMDLASNIDRRRFSPCVISTAMGGPMAEELESRGIPAHLLDYRGLSARHGRALPLFRDARRFFKAFARILEERRIAILHAYLPGANILAMAASLLRRPRVRIVSKRALCRYKEGHPIYSHFEDLANLAADAVMVNSQAVAEDVRRTERFVAGKMFLVCNGVDLPGETSGSGRSPLPADLHLPDDTLRIACIANLHLYKGHSDLIEAARRVTGTFPNVRFLLAGSDAGAERSIRRRIADLGLDTSVCLLGARSDVVSILAASDLLVHPSLEEGSSIAILEAMAAGKAVVATRVGGTPEAVENGNTGLLVPPGDPDALASAILELLRNPVKAETMGRAGRERIRNRFSLAEMVTGVEESYIELLSGVPLSRSV